jgi:CRISPR-associated protein Cst2
MRPLNVSKENRRFIQGAMIINAPSASLNLGQDGIKRISTKGEDGNLVRFSYLSGQFIKSKIKETLLDQGEKLSKPEIIQVPSKGNTPTTSCNPFEYLDDDLFGYMNVINSDNHENPGTTRVAPFKISYFLGKEGDITKDFAVKQNGALAGGGGLTTMPLDDNNRLFASTTYSGFFSIDVNFSGRFFKGSTSGFKNIAEKFQLEKYKSIIERQDEFEIVLSLDIRRERLQKLLKTLPFINGGARLATVYSDLSPKFVIYCVTDSGNHLFQEIASINQHFNLKALMESVVDFKSSIRSDIYIALHHGFLDNKRKEILEKIEKHNQEAKDGEPKFIFNNDLGGIKSLTDKFADKVIPELFKIKNI